MEKVNLNFHGLNFNKPLVKEEDKKATVEEKPQAKPEQKPVEDREMLNAMALSGAQNKAFITGLGSLPNPKDYLDDESIARIQGSVQEFESAVEKYTAAVNEEFGDTLSANEKSAIVLKAVNSLV